MVEVRDAYERLLKHFGPRGWWPLASCGDLSGFDEHGYHRGNYSYPLPGEQQFEVAVGAILAQNTSWVNAEKALQVLRQKGLLTRKKLHNVDKQRLAALIRSSGYFNQKAKKLKMFAGFEGEMTRENLLALWGVGKETADSILCYAYHQPVFVVDAYTLRIFHRLGFPEEGYDAVQAMVMGELKKVEDLNEFHALLVELGKTICTRQHPACERCPLTRVCAKRGV